MVQETAHFRALLPIAEMLVATGRYAPVFMFHTVYDGLSSDVRACERLGVEFELTWGRTPSPREHALVRGAREATRRTRWAWAAARRLGIRTAKSVFSRLAGVVSLVRTRPVSSVRSLARRADASVRAIRTATRSRLLAARRAARRMGRRVSHGYGRTSRIWNACRLRVQRFGRTLWNGLDPAARAAARHRIGVVQLGTARIACRVLGPVRALVRRLHGCSKGAVRAARVRRPARAGVRWAPLRWPSRWPTAVARRGVLSVQRLGARVRTAIRVARALSGGTARWGGRFACALVFAAAWLAGGCWWGLRGIGRGFDALADPVRRRVRFSVFLTTLRRYVLLLKLVRDVCEAHGIGAIVLAEDNVGHATGTFTRVGRERGAPILVFPYTVANAREFAESYFEVAEHQLDEWPNPWVARALPRWVHEHRGRRLMRLPGWDAVVQEALWLAPPQPWAFNSGHANAIVVENDILVDYYRRQGLHREPLHALGSPFDDRLAATLREADRRRTRLFDELRLPRGRRLLLTALPPNQIPSRPDCGYGDFEALVRDWLEPLCAAEDWNVVLRLHPRVRRDDLRFVEEELGLRISEWETADLVPLCDLYVASVSATIRWAVACGRPVVNYDVYGYRYDDYDEAAGVWTLEEHADYTRVVREMLASPASLGGLRLRQQSCMERWGRLDGRAGERILGLFDELTGVPPAAGAGRGGVVEPRRHAA